MAALCRFDELRNKTDKQLTELVNDALTLGIREAGQALRAAEAWTFGEGPHLRAKRAYTGASRLIPLIDEIPDHERKRLEAQRAHLRDMLDGLLVLGHPASTEDNIPTLAPALWNARDCPEGSPEEDWFQAERALQSQLVSVGN
jgi:Protein of unknown function (DUF2934)